LVSTYANPSSEFSIKIESRTISEDQLKEAMETFGKIQHFFMTKALKKLGSKVSYLDIIKAL
jgi:hypothetical protein